MKGDTKAGALPTTHVDLSFSDIVQNLDFGYMGTLEARKERWIIFTDLMYMRVSGDASVTGPGPTGPAVTVGADATVKQTMFSAALGYRVLDGATSLDLFGGARYNKIDVDADISGSLFGLSARVNRSGDKSWWDPYAAFRLTHRIDDKWSLVAYADAGGFGVGSDLTWQALFGANYAFSKTVTAKFGFRILKVDYDSGGFLYDMKNQGLVVGVGMKF
jgi:opacity protein-like surface antigen